MNIKVFAACLSLLVLISFVLANSPLSTPAFPEKQGALISFSAAGDGLRVATPPMVPSRCGGYQQACCTNPIALPQNSPICMSNLVCDSQSDLCVCPKDNMYWDGSSCVVTAFPISTYVDDNLDFRPDHIRGTSTSFPSGTSGFGDGLGPKVVAKEDTGMLLLPNGGDISLPNNLPVTEEQRVYLYSYTNYDVVLSRLRAENAKTGYEVQFTGALALCSDISSSFGSCLEKDLLSENHVQLYFLGSAYEVCSELAAGGSVTRLGIGKIEGGGFDKKMNLNNEITTSTGYTVKLVGLGGGLPGTEVAEFSILDGSGIEVATLSMRESTDCGYDLSPLPAIDGNLVIRVVGIEPGSFGEEPYADVSVYLGTLVMREGAEVSGAGPRHRNWRSSFVSARVGASEAVEKIRLYNDVDQIYASPVRSSLFEGESINVIDGEPGFSFSFNGLESVEYNFLSFFSQRSSRLPIGPGANAFGDFVSLSSFPGAFLLEPVGGVTQIYVAVAPVENAELGEVFYFGADGYFHSAGNAMDGIDYAYNPSEPTRSITLSADATETELTFAVSEFVTDLRDEESEWIIRYDAELEQFVNVFGSRTVDKIGYGSGSPAAFTSGYISWRGSVFNDITPASVSLEYAQTIAHALYSLERVA